MKVLGRAYKDNLILGIPMAVISVGLFVAIGIITWGDTVAREVVASLFFVSAFLLFIYFSVLIVLQIITKDDIILLNEDNKQLIVNRYRHTRTIYFSELEKAEYRNKGLLSLSFIIFPCKFSYGKIIFTLKNGERVVTPNIVDVIDTHKLILNKLSVVLGTDYEQTI